jgi:hypothetical protein
LVSARQKKKKAARLRERHTENAWAVKQRAGRICEDESPARFVARGLNFA